jgi:NADPH2:quinone reductase
VDEAALIEVTEDIPDAIVAGLGVAGLAAWLSLRWRAQLAAGETVLVLGATGAVGQLAVQIAKLLGAGRVVAVGRNSAALARARELGADAVVRLDGRGPAELAAEMEQVSDGPVNVIVDTLWGEPAVAAAFAAAPGARLVNLGQSASPTAPLPSAPLRGKLLTVLGHTNLLAPSQVQQAAFGRLAGHVASGELSLDCEAVALTEISDAWRRQAKSPHRKLIVAFPAS